MHNVRRTNDDAICFGLECRTECVAPGEALRQLFRRRSRLRLSQQFDSGIGDAHTVANSQVWRCGLLDCGERAIVVANADPPHESLAALGELVAGEYATLMAFAALILPNVLGTVCAVAPVTTRPAATISATRKFLTMDTSGNVYELAAARSRGIHPGELTKSYSITTKAVKVRAGPARAFSLVAWLQPATPINVIVCTSWCHRCDSVVGRWR